MSFIITEKTKFVLKCELSPAMEHALRILRRDFSKVFSHPLNIAKRGDVVFCMDETISCAEQFEITVHDYKIQIDCKDELAFVYAVLYFSREYLKVDDFWFWTEKEPKKSNRIVVEEGEYVSPTPKVRYRGWFVNDEVCLIGWSDVYPPSRKVWECVFETLLRLGGNMVIAGTDLPRDGEHFKIASEMGLYITHHHAEPLGAEMFLRAYPQEEPSYDTNAVLFERLWSAAIEENKHQKVIWTLGFRGQGDAPFWMNDPKYDTSESRAALIRRVIDRQYEMLRAQVENPICAVYLYGEIAELYEQGYLELPEQFIKIWSDNGYGKMVVRRQGTHNPRISSLPHGEGKHGIYYHVTFHDLQASSHLTMLGIPPETIDSELDAVLDAGAEEYWLINCGNIRPHVYLLALTAQKWLKGNIDVAEFKREFAKRYFQGAEKRAIDCYDEYCRCCISYGSYEDERAGEEFYFHSARAIMSAWIQGQESASRLVWATGEQPLSEQTDWIANQCLESAAKFEKLKEHTAQVSALLKEPAFFQENLCFQVKLHLIGIYGLLDLCKAYRKFTEGCLPEAFVILTDVYHTLMEGTALLERGSEGKWEGFYSADWLTNVRVTAEQTDALRKYVRMLGDAPDYFQWFKNYVIPETERHIYLENTQRRTLTDDELADKLSKRLQIK